MLLDAFNFTEKLQIFCHHIPILHFLCSLHVNCTLKTYSAYIKSVPKFISLPQLNSSAFDIFSSNKMAPLDFSYMLLLFFCLFSISIMVEPAFARCSRSRAYMSPRAAPPAILLSVSNTSLAMLMLAYKVQNNWLT